MSFVEFIQSQKSILLNLDSEKKRSLRWSIIDIGRIYLVMLCK